MTTPVKDVDVSVDKVFCFSEFEQFAMLDMVREARKHLEYNSKEAVEKRLDLIEHLISTKNANP